MSTIHEAHDATLGTRVAIKIMRGDLPIDPVDRFRREAHVLAALSHEHIARIIDRQDPEEGPRFLVTEYIDGLDLGVLRRRGPLPAAVVIQIGLQVSPPPWLRPRRRRDPPRHQALQPDARPPPRR
jgi:serine/threonine protein kinase